MKLLAVLPVVAAYQLTQQELSYAATHRDLLPKELQEGELTLARLQPYVKPTVTVTRADAEVKVRNASGVDPAVIEQIGKEVWTLVSAAASAPRVSVTPRLRRSRRTRRR